MSLWRNKFATDLIWNYASLAVLAVSGVALNFSISYLYGADALGVFNQVFALYIISSQLGVAGVHFSVLKHTAQYDGDSNEQATLLWSALVVVVGLSFSVSSVIYLCREFIGRLVASPAVAKSLAYAILGFFFFPLNKVLLSTLNGRRSMRVFAAGQALRYLLMLACVPLLFHFNVPSEATAAVFSISESALFVFLVGAVAFQLRGSAFRFDRQWSRRHLSFGYRGFVGGTLLELNSRIDVLLIGWLLSDRAVGIYSFAATLAEGFYQILIVVKNNLNPLLVKLLHERDFNSLRTVQKRTARWVYASVIPLSIALIVAYPVGIRMFELNREFLEGWPVLVLLVTGIVLTAGFSPFDTLLIQGGFPGTQTLFNATTVVGNLILNLLLIPLWGIEGAAAATALSLVLSLVVLNRLVSRRIGFRLWPGFSGNLAALKP